MPSTVMVKNTDSMDPDTEEEVLEVLNAKGPTAVTVIASTLDAHPITADRHCYELQRDGYISQTSGGVYRITDEGREYLSALPE